MSEQNPMDPAPPQGNAALVEQVASAMKLLEEEANRLVDLVQVFRIGAHGEARRVEPAVALSPPAPGRGPPGRALPALEVIALPPARALP